MVYHPTPPSYADQLLINLARNLRVARVGNGWTQKKLAKRAKVSRYTVTQVEQAETDLRLSTLADLAQALGVSPLLLLIGEDEFRELAREQIGSIDSDWQATVDELPVKRMERLVSTRVASSENKAAKLGANSLPASGAGAAAGAAIGSVLFPGVGTVVGAALGASFGATIGVGVMSFFRPKIDDVPGAHSADRTLVDEGE